MQENSRRDELTANMPLELARKKKLTQTQQKQKYDLQIKGLDSN